MNIKTCRFCNSTLKHIFADLGMSPLANSYIKEEQLHQAETFYPLTAYVCNQCYLVQLGLYELPHKIFTEYFYFSSYSNLWLDHCRNYTEMIVERLKLDESSMVIEVGSNDGYLLKYFIERKIPVLGIEPAGNIARVAAEQGVPTLVRFFTKEIACDILRDYRQADLIVGKNVLAQIPELNDFVSGLKILLKPGGIITIEYPHLMNLITSNQYDTIYHEHYSYFSLHIVEKIFEEHGLTVFDVEELPTHGGSLRIYAKHSDNPEYSVSSRVSQIKNVEVEFGLLSLDTYLSFNEQIKQSKRKILEFFISLKNNGKTIAGYGAPAKGNTLLNYCAIRTDIIDYTVDMNPYKQGKYLPGTHIPIHHPHKLIETKPDYVLILPWNLKEEITEQLSFVHEWCGKFIILIPDICEYDNNNWSPVTYSND